MVMVPRRLRGVSSRLALDPFGRQVVIVTTPSPQLSVGEWFLVVDPTVFGLLPTRTGRSATARELAWNRRDAPYESNRRPPPKPEVPDEELAEAEAIRLARLEQQREPVHLVSAAA